MNAQLKNTSLDKLVFDNRLIRELPADSETANFCRQVLGACYSRVTPMTVPNPQLVAYATEVAEKIGLDMQTCESEYFVQVFAGNTLSDGMDPYASCYGGHQFGNWAGQLGDGRAINLGEVINHQDERWALQLKGAGPTPYSRTADGLAVLRSSVREFLCSEAMHHLGVPTTRALSLITSGESVVRDMFYDGNPKPEPGAIVCRAAPSFIRFGNFEIFAARNDINVLKQLMDYTIRTDFSHLGEPSPKVYITWFEEVCRKTAEMIVHWMRVGFVHGVMNTDNMSILGLTIDYGPYGWLEGFDPDWTPNTTDAQGRRYRFGNQAQIALWNLTQLASAIHPIIDQSEPLQQGLSDYISSYTQGWQDMMAQKLGLNSFITEIDTELMEELLVVLQLVETDMTLFYRKLAIMDLDVRSEANELPADTASNTTLIEPLLEAFYAPEDITTEHCARWANWIRRYRLRLAKDGTSQVERCLRMNAVNPKYVLRNYLAQLATDKAETGDYSMVNELLDVLRRPYDEQPSKEEFAKKRPEWARNRAGCSMLSCSS